jgi:ketosteroid isomerase-like protein
VTNREIVEDAFAAFQRGDLAAAFRRTVPDVEFDNRAGGADVSGVWRGIDGFTELMDKINEAFSEYSLELLETNERGDDVILTLREHVRGKASGAEVERRLFITYAVHDGLITRIKTGLEPPAG